MIKKIVASLLLTTACVTTFATNANANGICSIGQRGKVLWQGKWYSAKVLNTSGSQCYITYEGYDSSWDEWVGPDRFRGSYQVGQSVQILWRGKWYPGQILGVSGNQYKVTYYGYDSSWDEWVETARLR